MLQLLYLKTHSETILKDFSMPMKWRLWTQPYWYWFIREKNNWPNFSTVVDIHHNGLENDLFQPACHSPSRQEEAACPRQMKTYSFISQIFIEFYSMLFSVLSTEATTMNKTNSLLPICSYLERNADMQTRNIIAV